MGIYLSQDFLCYRECFWVFTPDMGYRTALLSLAPHS